MRICKIAVGCRQLSHPCCADCGDKTCQARCLNSPSRCGCCDNGLPKRTRRSKIDDEQLLALSHKGLLQRDIANILGCSAANVSARLRRLGVTRYG